MPKVFLSPSTQEWNKYATEGNEELYMKSALGERIIKFTEQNGMTQRDLAGRIGISEVSLSRYINGDRSPRPAILSDLASALNVSVSDLTGDAPGSAQGFENEYYQIHRLIARNASQMTAQQKTEIVNALFESIPQKG